MNIINCHGFLKIPEKADILSDIPERCCLRVMLSENMVNGIC